MMEILLVANLLVSVGTLAAVFIKVGRVLQRQDEHERRISAHDREFLLIRGGR